jgi:hypothetical protein
MNKSESQTSGEGQNCVDQSMVSQWDSAHWAFICATNPQRARWRKTDIPYAKYHAKRITALLAMRGPRSFDEPAARSLEPVYGTDEMTEFDSQLGSPEEWRHSSWCLSQLSDTWLGLMSTMDKDDPLFPDMYETLGILAYAQARIAQALLKAR